MGLADQYRKEYEGYVSASQKAPIKLEQLVKDAYRGPVEQLIKEGETARPKAYSQFFNAFGDMGTGAADLSPAAALGEAINQGQTAMTGLNTNRSLREYYNTMINDLVGKAMQGFQMGMSGTKSLWDAEMAREEAAKNRAAMSRGGGGGSTPFMPFNLEEYLGSLDPRAAGGLNFGGSAMIAAKNLIPKMAGQGGIGGLASRMASLIRGR